MPKYVNHLDLSTFEIRNATIQVLAASPASPAAGRLYFDSTLNTARVYNGNTASWVNLDATMASGIPISALATNPLARANHTGTQTAATISDLATTVKGYSLDMFAVPVASVSMNSQRITNQADPVNPQDSATKNYVDVNIGSASAGIVSKPAVRLVSTTNIATLSGLATVDSVATVAGDRVLLTGQTTQSQNGVYIIASGAWSRASGDGSGNNELSLGATWYISQGTTYAASTWRLATPTSGAITPGTTAVTITQLLGAQTYTASNGVQLAGSNFSAAVVASGGVLAAAGGLSVDTTIVARKYETVIGDGSATSYVVTHNLNNQFAILQAFDTSGNVVYPDMQGTTANTATFSFGSAQTLNSIHVTVIG